MNDDDQTTLLLKVQQTLSSQSRLDCLVDSLCLIQPNDTILERTVESVECLTYTLRETLVRKYIQN